MNIRSGLFLHTILLLCLCICCGKDKDNEDEIDYSLIDPKTGAYTFPLRPEMPEWAELESNEEMIAALQIPENILNIITDSGLVNTCFIYPRSFIYLLFEPDIHGIAIVVGEFNGLQELMRRPGVPAIMLYKYKKYELIENVSEIYENFQKMDSLMRFCYFEYLLSSDPILSKLTDEQLKELFIEALKKINQKINYNYSFTTSVSTAFLLAKIMLYKEFEPLLRNDSMVSFAHSSVLKDISFQDIIDLANDFVQTFNNVYGNWVVVSFNDLESDSIIEKKDVDSWGGMDVEIKFMNDSTFCGRNTTNDIAGHYTMRDSSFDIDVYGGTKVGQPEWGNLFSDVVHSHSFAYFKRSYNELRLFYNSNRNCIVLDQLNDEIDCRWIYSND